MNEPLFLSKVHVAALEDAVVNLTTGAMSKTGFADLLRLNRRPTA